jgi:formylglycine-generating enzyme required for sulfatase activity
MAEKEKRDRLERKAAVERAREEGARKDVVLLEREQEEAERKRLSEEKQKAEEEAKAKDPLNPLQRGEAGEKIKFNLPTDVVMTFAWCPAGSFRMGGTVHSDEQPIHKVTLTKGFYMGIYPVTQAQWKAVMGTDPSCFKGVNRPVESVTWHECNEFCTKLGGLLKGQVTVRLPSEAEWEYACRAGTTTEFHFGNAINTDLANYDGNYSFNDSPKGKCRKETTDVGSFPANMWGLYDVHGNVWEWCRDAKRIYTAADHTDPDGQLNGDTRVMRGGSWRYSPGYCRAAYRSRNTPAYRGCNCGFRVCFLLD